MRESDSKWVLPAVLAVSVIVLPHLVSMCVTSQKSSVTVFFTVALGEGAGMALGAIVNIVFPGLKWNQIVYICTSLGLLGGLVAMQTL